MEFNITENLFPNILTIVVQLGATLVLFLLVKKLLWKPAMNILNERKEKMVKDLDDAKAINEEANLNLKEVKDQMREAKLTSQEIINNSRNEANKIKEEIINQAKIEAQNKIEEADRHIDEKIKEAQAKLHNDIVDVAMVTVNKIMSEIATSKDDEEIINEFTSEDK